MALERLEFLDAIEAIRANVYRRRLIEVFGSEQAWLDASVSVGRSTPAWRLIRELKYDALPSCVRMLTQHWKP